MRTWGFLPSKRNWPPSRPLFKLSASGGRRSQPPFPASFDGQLADVHALDYMNYEGIGFPQAEVQCGRWFAAK